MLFKLALGLSALLFCAAATNNQAKPEMKLELKSQVHSTVMSAGAINQPNEKPVKNSSKKNASLVEAEKQKEVTNCAKIPLSAIYAAEKSFFSEYEHYNEVFEKIGYQQGTEEAKECAHWTVNIRTGSSGGEFEAFAENTRTGELWKIDDKKNLAQEKAGQP